MSSEYVFSIIDLSDDYIRSGRSVIVATLVGDQVDESAVASMIDGRWINHGRPIDFEPTHFANPRAVKVH